MADLYSSFAALAAAEQEGTQWSRAARHHPGATWSSIAIHGGGIEIGSEELAYAVAQNMMSSYVFAGLKSSGNSDLHITSTVFDEPTGLALVASTLHTLSFHGFVGVGKQTALGGMDRALMDVIYDRLTAEGFNVIPAPDEIAGANPLNICNKNKRRRGVQLEMSTDQRKAFFPNDDWSRAMRETGARTDEFWAYANVMRSLATLDDALNSSSITWLPASLMAKWNELPSTLDTSGNPDAVCFLSDQMTGDYEVEHSLDDGLPDAVTLTTGNDAGGKLSVPLLGRAGNRAVTAGWRTSTTQNGLALTAGAQASFAFPADIKWGDYVIAALTVNSQVLTITQKYEDVENDHHWDLLLTTQDGSFTTQYIYGRQYWTGLEPFTFSPSGTLNWSGIKSAVYARSTDPTVWVDIVPGNVLGAPEPSATAISAHVAPTCRLDRRGFVASVWSTSANSTAPPFTYTGPGAELAEVTVDPLKMMMASTSLSNPGNYTPTMTTTGNTAVLMMASIGLEIADRRRMDAREYFSPFNDDSPVYGFDRDTAEVTLSHNVLTSLGPTATQVFQGQMEDITIKGREAEMSALSKTRLDMDKSLTLPVVSGDRENCSIDWLATWAMARGGQYAGPSPSPYTRAWAPAYGSVHPHFASDYSYAGAIYYDADLTPTGPFSQRPPSFVTGPFVTAMYGQQTATRIEEPFINFIRLDRAKTGGLQLPYTTDTWTFAQQFVKTQSAGRLVFWIRGDAATTAPSYVVSDNDFLMKYDLFCKNAAGDFLGYVMVSLSSADRYIRVRMGADHTGSTTVVFSTIGAIPSDGAWHFVGVKWDFAAGVAVVRIDGSEISAGNYATNGDNDPSLLPNTEEGHVNAGGTYTNYFRTHLPFSDVLLEAGPQAFSRDFTDHYPTPIGKNAIMRPTYQPLSAVVETSPVQGWDLLVALASASMSAYRTNEEDVFEFLPPSYFGEIDQIVPVTITDTEVNAAELDVTQDPSKTRNAVTINFPETRVNSKYSSIMDLSSAMEIPRGLSDVVFSLDSVAAEVHGQINPMGITWQLTNLTAAQVAAPSTIPTNVHFMTVNLRQDGSDTAYQTNLTVTARIIEATASTVTVRFSNSMGKSVYLSNNGDSVPYLRLLGYGVTTTDAYVVQKDQGSITRRKDRPLDVDLDWVQDRETATGLAQLMVTNLARPRPEVEVETMGDPRRRPGQLVQLSDSQGTQAEGTWRVMSVKHMASRAKYTQLLKLVRIDPSGVWDSTDWDASIWAP